MKKLLAILAGTSLSVTAGASFVVACSTPNTNLVQLSSISRVLSILIHAKQNDMEPWTNEALEKEIVEQKIDVEGGISVIVDDQIKEGSTTNLEQTIFLQANGNKKNQYKYEGNISIIYAFGGNKPAPKYKINQFQIEQTIKGLETYLENITYNNLAAVERTFKPGNKIPGMPAEGLMFKEVNFAFVELNKPSVFVHSDPIARPSIKFVIDGEIGIKDDDVFEFDENVVIDNLMFSNIEGQMFEPVMLEEPEVEQVTSSIINWILTGKDYSDFNEFSQKIRQQEKVLIDHEGISFDLINLKEIVKAPESKNWTINVEISLKANESLGYTFSKEVLENNHNVLLVPIEVLKLSSDALVLNVLKKTNLDEGRILPQLIQFDQRNLNKLAQYEYLVDQQITSTWGDDQQSKQAKQLSFVKSLKLFTGSPEEIATKEQNLVKNGLFNNTSSFNYEHETLSPTDKILFFDKKAADINESIKTILGTTNSLEELSKNAILEKDLQIKTSYNAVFLSKTDQNLYEVSNRTFNVTLEEWKVID